MVIAIGIVIINVALFIKIAHFITRRRSWFCVNRKGIGYKKTLEFSSLLG